MKRFDVQKAIEYSKRFKNNSNKELSDIAYFVNEMLTQSSVDEAEKPDPDPIIEVYNKFKDMVQRNDSISPIKKWEWWHAIKKYAEGKGKK